MLIHRVRLVNFRQHEDTTLALGQGLTGIIGPNGAGKTTLLEAIAWAMYGTPAARGSRDSIKRRGAPPRARVEVELEFSLGPHQFRIVRTLTQAELYQDGGAAPIANSIQAVSERVTRLLGMSREEFFRTYFTSQKELAFMGTMTAGERGQFLSRVLGYERLREAQERLRTERSALKARVAALASAMPDPVQLDRDARESTQRVKAAATQLARADKALAASEAQAAELAPRWEAAQRERDAAARHQADLRLAEQALVAATAGIKRVRGELAEARRAAARVAELGPKLEPLKALREEAVRLARESQGHARRAGKEAERKQVAARVQEVAAALREAPERAAVEAAIQRLDTLREAHEFSARQAEERRTLWVQDRQEARTRREGLADQYRELGEQKERIVAAGPDGACPTCGRPLGKDFASMLGVLDRQMEAVAQNGSFYRQRIEQLKDEPPELATLDAQVAALQSQLEEAHGQNTLLLAAVETAAGQRAEQKALAKRLGALEKELAALPGGAYDEARHRQVNAQVEKLQPLALEAEREGVLAARLPALGASMTTLEGSEREHAASVATLKAALKELGFREDRFQKLQQQWTEADAGREEARLVQVRAQAERDAAQAAAEDVARRQAERVARQGEMDGINSEIRLTTELDAALGDLRTELNATLRPDISELASVFLRDLTSGRYTELELDEEYATTLVDDGEPKGVISGGEEDIANLALRLAISQMIAERAGQPLSLLVLDEIFGSLDDDRRTAVVELLRGLADRFPQVILITHIDSVRDGFDRIIRVSYDARRGVATAEDEPVGGHDVAA